MIITRVAFLLLFCILVIAKEYRTKGDSCTLPNNEAGICQSFKDCPDAKKIRPEICGFEGKYPIICCNFHNKTESIKLTKSEEFCAKNFAPTIVQDEEYSDDYAIYGGDNAIPLQFPHMAILGYGKKEDIKWGCGGSLISYRHILTAAHCLHSRELGGVKFIRLGDLNLTSNFDLAEPQDFIVAKKNKHPDYHPPSKYQDIAILELNRDVNITNYVKPACLQIKTNINQQTLVATGWGKLEYVGESAEHLQVVNLDKISNVKCNEEYKHESKNKLALGIVEKWQICAGKDNADTCQGDSGGPLQIQNEKYSYGWQIVGITSFGKACGVANSAGVYTRVSNYIDWIESVVWP